MATIQGGLAPLLANLAAAMGRSDLPQAVQGAAQTLLSLGLDGAALDGEAIEAALSKSGIFLERSLASGEPVQGDLKHALISLRDALRSALPQGARVPALSSSLPPPHRSALPVGEPPSLPSIALLDGEAAGLKLLAETDGALARTTLLQLASLPDSAQSNTTQRLVVDIPIATPQGHAVVQLQIETEDEHRDGPGEERSPSWRINLAIDIEPLGPVRARIAQIDGRTHVNLYAEREVAARALRDDLPALQTQLSQAALEPGDLHCRTGVPQCEPARPGLFVDRAS
ncbi:MAG: flagellar hook-length control protein FliK [Pseudorhodoplanes sp.]